MLGLIGKKVGMTQLFVQDGSAVPVTAIEAGPCPILQVKTDERDGYRAIQLAFGSKKARRSSKAEVGHAMKAGLEYAPAITGEFTLGAEDELAEDPHTPASSQKSGDVGDAEAIEEGGRAAADPADSEDAEVSAGAADSEPLAAGLRVGHVLTVAMFGEGERVKITGHTKGRGFQGVVKRHGFSGYPKSHGHPFSRRAGSIGPGTDPSRVIKGRKMSGRMGGSRRTERNVKVVKVDEERNLLFVRGSVPGARNGWVFVAKQ